MPQGYYMEIFLGISIQPNPPVSQNPSLNKNHASPTPSEISPLISSSAIAAASRVCASIEEDPDPDPDPDPDAPAETAAAHLSAW